MRLLVDSSFMIDHLRGEAAASARWDRLFADGDRVFVNDVVACEVRAGLHPHEEAVLRKLLAPLEFIQAGPEAAILAGQWRADSRARGFTLSVADALIAAAADAVDAGVLTRNIRHFALTPVPIETY